MTALKIKPRPAPRRPGGILMAMPAYNQMVQACTTESIFSTGQWLTAQGIPNQMAWFSAADIVEVRNLFVTMWYDTRPEFEWMLFIDADMGWHPALIRDYLRFGKPLMGTFYAKRQMQPAVVGTAAEGHSIKDVVEGFLPASDLGGGLMMINRCLVAELLRQKPELSDPHSWLLAGVAKPFGLTRIIRAFDTIIDERGGRVRRLSEDVSFCHRWRECGGEVWANVNHSISHVGPFDYHLRYAGVLEAKAKQAADAAQGS